MTFLVDLFLYWFSKNTWSWFFRGCIIWRFFKWKKGKKLAKTKWFLHPLCQVWQICHTWPQTTLFLIMGLFWGSCSRTLSNVVLPVHLSYNDSIFVLLDLPQLPPSFDGHHVIKSHIDSVSTKNTIYDINIDWPRQQQTFKFMNQGNRVKKYYLSNQLQLTQLPLHQYMNGIIIKVPINLSKVKKIQQDLEQ